VGPLVAAWSRSRFERERGIRKGAISITGLFTVFNGDFLVTSKAAAFGSDLLHSPTVVISSDWDKDSGAATDIQDFITSKSGLRYSDVVRGDGGLPHEGQTVRVHYTGWLDAFDGEKKFDSSYDRRTPLAFKVGTHQVITGWDEALLTDMPVGTKRKVLIPAELAYGKRGAGGIIPPNADLYFVMELVGTGVR
jgi:peptidylprolyl isomerase